MCQFLSAIVTRKGEILCEPLTDSHEDLIRHFALREGVGASNFVRVEFTPAEGEEGKGPLYSEPDKYTLRVDEVETPDWFDDELRETTVKHLRGRIERMIVRDRRAILLGGVWIVAGEAVVEVARNCRIVSLSGSSSVQRMYGSSSVTEMYGSSSVQRMYGSSSVTEMYGSSSVTEMYGSSSVQRMYGSSSVQRMYGSSSVTEMYGSSKAPKKPTISAEAK